MVDDFDKGETEELLLPGAAPEREYKAARGRLKIFLGAAAGVGKTYRMLSQANELKTAGIDVVVGIAETHGRAETEALLKGLEVIPRKEMAYQGATFDEMDLDAVLARRPKSPWSTSSPIRTSPAPGTPRGTRTWKSCWTQASKSSQP